MIASRILLSACALLAATSAARAQSASEPNDPATPGDYFAVHAAFDAWNAQHGGHWQMVYETEYGAGRFLYGGSTASAAIPANDAEFVELARAALEDTYPIHHIGNATLVADEVMFLPLALAGSTDKMTVQFRQELAGVPVIRGFANVLFDLRGHVLSIDTTAMPNLASLSTSPAIDAQRAAQIAARLFQSDTRLAPTQVGAPELAIDPVLEGKFRRPVLVWRVDVQFAAADMDAEGFEYRIDAQTGRLSSRESSIHTWDVSGNVKSLATPGLFPDSATNPPIATDMPNLTVTSASGNANTDASGNFNIVGAAAPLTVTVKYVGPYATVTNTAGSNFTMSPSLAASSGNAIVMNSPAATFSTAETNAFYWTNVQRNWTRMVNPSDATHDFQAVANVNITSTCNAYYNGTSTNFYQAGGGCVNTAYSDVVMHETGHWMNDRYGSGNGSDGFGEGNADDFAMYVTDDPVLGHDFSGPGSYIRSGLNTRQFCGDSSPGCYGEVHADGEVLMGALWKVRARLKVGLGNAPGITAANVLFNAWMNAYNDGQIKTIVEKHWLTLDDNDGNLQNGTPNFAHINGGFVDQGFDLPYHTFSVTPIADTQDQIGPYVVQATIAAEFSTQVPSATVHYRVNGGAFATVAMSNSGGNAWTGAIPGHACTAFFDYYISATDGGGHTSVYPVGAPNGGQLHFAVANIIPISTENFENGTNGWTHAQVATQDDWMISSQFPVTISYGNAGDPTVPAVSGTSIWGNDLGPPGFNGFYSANVSNYLRSPILDCTGFTGVNLKFNRWLTVEKSQYDHADVKVNGNIVWSNPFATDLLDTSWAPVVIDISQYADNNPSVQIEFSLVSDGGLQYGGWNIDDVQLIQYGQCGSSCPTPTNYCTAKTTSLGGTPVVSSNGTASLATNNFSVRLTGGPPQRHAICFWSDTTGATPYTGGFMCVGLPQRRMPATFTDVTGAATQSIPIDPSMVGSQRHYQWWFRDPPDPFHVGLSDALTVTFCN